MSVWRLLERPSLLPVWQRVHAALERNAEARSVRLEGLTAEARLDLQGLLGLPARPTAEFRLDLRRLDSALARVEAGLDGRAVVCRLVGPIVDRRAHRAELAASEAQMWEEARGAVDDRLHPWLDQLQSTGLLKSLATKSDLPAQTMLARAVACATALPASGTLLQVFASERVGDPHALDQNRPLAAIVLRAAALLVGWEDIPRSPSERRALWAEVGVLTEGHSSHVLVHGFRPVDDSPLSRHLREQADRGLPRKITLAELQVERVRLAPGTRVFLVENVSVLDEAARRYGGRCSPIVCLDGEPTVAVWEILAGLRDRCVLAFHCDFDPAGVRIANRVHHRVGARPWRYDAEHYERAVRAKANPTAIEGTVTETPWDRGLADAMRRMEVAVFEEDVLEELVGDVALATPERPDEEVPF